jgi:hypothetical protein
MLLIMKADAEERRQAAALRFVQVHRWDGPVSAMVKLRLTFAEFFVEAQAAARISGASRLYSLHHENWEARQPLTAATFGALLELSRDPSNALPDIYVFETMSGTQASPGEPPARLALDVGAPRSAAIEDSCSSRSSAVQSLFRRMLLRRDGEASGCALCGERPVEAAHVIPRIASPELLALACLPDADFVGNGILLCSSCHFLHDQFMWHYMPSTGVVVAAALASDGEQGALWSARAGRQLARPAGQLQASWWPAESVWMAAHSCFEAAREARHAFAGDNAFACANCDWRGKTMRGLQNHTGRCDNVKTKLFTP